MADLFSSSEFIRNFLIAESTAPAPPPPRAPGGWGVVKHEPAQSWLLFKVGDPLPPPPRSLGSGRRYPRPPSGVGGTPEGGRG